MRRRTAWPLLLALSGVATRDDALAMRSVGACGILVGESLMRSPAPGVLLRSLLVSRNCR